MLGSGLALAWGGKAAVADAPALLADKTSGAKLPLVLEDFDGYASNVALYSKWFQPPHGNKVNFTLEDSIKNGGKCSLKFNYVVGDGSGPLSLNYGGIANWTNWNCAGYNVVQYWLKPDGSGLKFTLQFNIGNNDPWEWHYIMPVGETEPRIVSIPLHQFAHPSKIDVSKKSKYFKTTDIMEMALYVGGSKTAQSGVLYIDDITMRHDPSLPDFPPPHTGVSAQGQPGVFKIELPSAAK